MIDRNQMTEIIRAIYKERGQGIIDSLYNAKIKAFEIADSMIPNKAWVNNGGFMCWENQYSITEDELKCLV